MEGEDAAHPRGALTAADLFSLGLTGTPDAAARRAALLQRLDLPAHLSNKALLAVLNALYAPEELTQLLASAEEEMEPDGE